MDERTDLDEIAWAEAYNEGYRARMAGKPRTTQDAQRSGGWIRGYDVADKKLTKS